MTGTGSTIQRRKNTRISSYPSEDGTTNKERDKKRGGNVVAKLFHRERDNRADKSEAGTNKKKKKPKTSCRQVQRKRSSNNITPVEGKNHFIFTKPHLSIPLKNDQKITDAQKQQMHKFASDIVKKGPLEMSIEFLTKVKTYVGQPMKREVFDANPTKNRYKDVVCNDITRVAILDGKEDTLGDYVHANYVHGFNVPYILTQGPLERTVVDFWRMIMHTKAAFIVMLCETNEDGKPKCHQYWPDKAGTSLTFGDITITCKTEEDKDEHVIKSLLSVKTSNGTEHVCRHLHTKTWPDKFVPSSTLSLLRMLYVIRGAPGPNVVHCSAGIGRTGTFVAVEACLQTIADEKELDLINTIKALRNSRLGSVQVDVQYMTLVQIMLNYGKENGFWDDSDLDDRIELLSWNLSQFVQTRGKPSEPPATPTLPSPATPPPPPAVKKGSKDESDDDDKETNLHPTQVDSASHTKSGEEFEKNSAGNANHKDENKDDKNIYNPFNKVLSMCTTQLTVAANPSPNPAPQANLQQQQQQHSAPPKKYVFVPQKSAEPVSNHPINPNQKIPEPMKEKNQQQMQPQAQPQQLQQQPQKYKQQQQQPQGVKALQPAESSHYVGI